MIFKCIILIGLVSVNSFSSDFSYEGMVSETVKESKYVAQIKLISYVVLGDITKYEDLKEKCGYFNYVETYQVLDVYKGDLPKYIMVKKRGEYCGKFNRKQFNIVPEEISLGGLNKKNTYYYFSDFLYQIPNQKNLIDKIKKEVKKK